MTSLLKGTKNMSVKEAKAFLTALKQKESDEALKEKAAVAKTEEERLSFFADTARDMGYDVSAEDISEALVQMQQEDIVALEDDALEDVVGGGRVLLMKDGDVPKITTIPTNG